MKDTIKLILEDVDKIPEDFHELKNMLEQLENPNKKCISITFINSKIRC